jgi:DNA (cytosine-5)-methyltransferase 1
MLKVLDLFSGIGGFSLGLERTGGFKTVAFCEIDPFCRRVLAKHWPGVPIHEDVRKLKGTEVGAIDVVCGGYPCQPFSLAGKRGGAADDRHLWPEMRRLVDELRPSWVIGENVAGHIGMGLDDVLSDLEALDYACRTFVVPACAVGAWHRRDRAWIIAYAGSEQHEVYSAAVGRAIATELSGDADSEGEPTFAIDAQVARVRELVADADNSRLEVVVDGDAGKCEAALGSSRQWAAEPNVGRVAHGVPSRVDRLRGLGNAVVPQIPEAIGRAILKAESVAAARDGAVAPKGRVANSPPHTQGRMQ